MSKTLGGATFAWNAISQDYSIIECLECIYELCDEVCVVFGGNDGTVDLINKWILSKAYGKNIYYLVISQAEWDAQQGREKLSYFSNIAIANLETDYFFYLQADEILHEDSFQYVREAIEQDQEGFYCRRINLWSCPYTALNVPHHRKPVSTEVLRLAKKQYQCVDDAESVFAPNPNTDYLDKIRIYHVGFVRDKHKHLVKIKHIQEDIFLFGEADKRIHDCVDGFDPWKFGFGIKDVEPITEKLPKFIQQWASEREVDPFKYTKDGIVLSYDFLALFGHLMTFPITEERIVNEANKLWWMWAKQFQK